MPGAHSWCSLSSLRDPALLQLKYYFGVMPALDSTTVMQLPFEKIPYVHLCSTCASLPHGGHFRLVRLSGCSCPRCVDESTDRGFVDIALLQQARAACPACAILFCCSSATGGLGIIPTGLHPTNIQWPHPYPGAHNYIFCARLPKCTPGHLYCTFFSVALMSHADVLHWRTAGCSMPSP